MDKKEVIKSLLEVVDKFDLATMAGVKNEALAGYMYACVENLSKVNGVRVDDSDVEEFIDRMYALYPAKCPKRGTSLGKSYKDKDRIRKLLKRYSFEEIERVIQHEVESKYEKSYMQNFSTFLNNFPDPSTGEESTYAATPQQPGVLIIDGQEYR